MGVLITGAGMVGTHLAQLMSRDGEDVTLFELSPVMSYIGKMVDLDKVKLVRGDVTNVPDLVAALQQCGASCIIHTAALLGAAVDSAPYTACKVNVVGTVNVMEAARLTGVKRVVFTSTQGVYDRRATGPMTEDQPLGPNALYGATKLAAELLALKYGQRYGIDVVVVRYAIAYGYTFSAAGSIYGKVINELLDKASRGLPVVVQRTEPFLYPVEFIYVRDMARAAALAARAHGLKDRTFNIGTGELNDLSDLAAAVRSEVPGAQITIEEPYGPLRHDPTRYPYDLTRAREQLGYEPAYPLAAGVRDYLATMAAARG